jgi:hypothetical protein
MYEGLGKPQVLFGLALPWESKRRHGFTYGASKPKQVCETGPVIENCCGKL